MNKLAVFGFLLLGFAAMTSANGEWYHVGCYDTYNMGDSGGMDLIPCAISQSTGGGGSTVITNYDYYCLKFEEWSSSGNFKLHVKLYKGASCLEWDYSDYCSEHPSQCDKYISWGDNSVMLGGGWFGYIKLNYGYSDWGPLAFGHNPYFDWMNFKIRIEPQSKQKSVVK